MDSSDVVPERVFDVDDVRVVAVRAVFRDRADDALCDATVVRESAAIPSVAHVGGQAVVLALPLPLVGQPHAIDSLRCVGLGEHAAGGSGAGAGFADLVPGPVTPGDLLAIQVLARY